MSVACSYLTWVAFADDRVERAHEARVEDLDVQRAFLVDLDRHHSALRVRDWCPGSPLDALHREDPGPVGRRRCVVQDCEHALQVGERFVVRDTREAGALRVPLREEPVPDQDITDQARCVRLVVPGEPAVDRLDAVLEGLVDGDMVVTNANFLIDAESSLRAVTGGHVH